MTVWIFWLFLLVGLAFLSKGQWRWYNQRGVVSPV